MRREDRIFSEGSLTDLRNRLAIRYAVEADLRFISHHDSLRLFERALVRAGLPLRYSEGFNPRPRLSIALPRPVGVASSDELLVIEVTEPLEMSVVMEQLSPQMPPGLALLSAEPLADSDRRLPCEASYSLPVEPAVQATVARRISEILAADQLPVDRILHSGADKSGVAASKSIDIRPYILSIELTDGCVRWRQLVTGTGTVRVTELLDVLGIPGRENLHRVRREQVCYQA